MLSTHFSVEEFQCKCCHKIKISSELIEKLELLRQKLGNKPIIINSGYRCEKHNQEIGGATNSYHVKGMAADIVVRGVSPREVAKLAEEVGFNGIGIYRSWTHVDVRKSKARWEK